MEVVFLNKEQLHGNVAEVVAPIVANEIALLLDSDAQVENRDVDPGDIAVLCRSNNQALAVTGALRALNVPVSLDGDSSVLSTAIAKGLARKIVSAKHRKFWQKQRFTHSTWARYLRAQDTAVTLKSG